MPSAALVALYEGDMQRARELLGADAELDVFDAAAFGRIQRLRRLLQDDPSLANAYSDDGFTALHLAAFGAQEEAARALIDAGADLEAISRAEFAQVTPLGTAVFVGSLPLVRLLLDAGADVNAKNTSGGTALDAARANGDDELARELESRGGRANRA